MCSELGYYEQMEMEYPVLPPFPPPPSDYETLEVSRALVVASRPLAGLDEAVHSIPDARILLSTLGLQEAQSSSAIENIITTQQALHEYRIRPDKGNVATKEAARYAEAMEAGWREVRESGLLSCRTIIGIQQILTGHETQWRTLPGTVLQNVAGETVYTPPPPDEVPRMMAQLEGYLNADNGADPLIKMALAHSRFESIHPFYDGNGRTGRIINILFLIQKDLLNAPVLYLSRFINETRGDYYRLLRRTQSGYGWQEWLLYMLRGIAATARHTIGLVKNIRDLHNRHEERIRALRMSHRRELVDAIFIRPYIKATVLADELKISRPTAARYLDALAKGGVLTKTKPRRENYYINAKLINLLVASPEMEL